jgi:hypothetical protein
MVGSRLGYRTLKGLYRALCGVARAAVEPNWDLPPARSGEQGPCVEEGPVLGPISGGWFWVSLRRAPV